MILIAFRSGLVGVVELVAELGVELLPVGRVHGGRDSLHDAPAFTIFSPISRLIIALNAPLTSAKYLNTTETKP